MSEQQTQHAAFGRPIPAPPVSLETEEFWKRARDGRFAIKRCVSCQEAFWYPRAICPLCHSSETAWEDSPGTGTVYTYSIVRTFPTGPFAIGFVTLDEGPLVLTNFVDFAEGDLAIGKRVKVRFVATDNDGPPAPVFGPA
ncbi:MAG: DNA-binding protein [Rhodospirillaceae bacterium]|nr:MAG: DNA-binding protein [Rhodospirillaceae bacterium]